MSERRVFIRKFLTGPDADSYVKLESYDWNGELSLKLADCNRNVQLSFSRKGKQAKKDLKKARRLKAVIDKLVEELEREEP